MAKNSKCFPNKKLKFRPGIFEGILSCKRKAYLKLNGEIGVKSDYENIHAQLKKDYKKSYSFFHTRKNL